MPVVEIDGRPSRVATFWIRTRSVMPSEDSAEGRLTLRGGGKPGAPRAPSLRHLAAVPAASAIRIPRGQAGVGGGEPCHGHR